MAVPVLTFFNNKGGVGKTSLVYHLAWMFSEIGHRVLACDLDPQANLTAAFLAETRLEVLWNDSDEKKGSTIFRCVSPLLDVGDLLEPKLESIASGLRLIPGDLALSGFEDGLSQEWPRASGSENLRRPFRILSAFWTIMQLGAKAMDASIILADVGPNLGAINRSALIATDHVIVPLGADLFSLQGLRNLGPTLRRWRADWRKKTENWEAPSFPLPEGKMAPLGYVVQQHSVRLDRPVKAYDKWINRIPEEYATSVLNERNGPFPRSPENDAHCLATLKHYRSLVPMAQEARKPIFHLSSADGAIGSHAVAVANARDDFYKLAKRILGRAVSA
jgi:cellulose biosynthesis protein BcsQ